MSGKVYYITEFSDPKDRHKFQAQIEGIFSKNGFVPISYPRNYFLRLFFLLSILPKLNKGDIIFFIHPLYTKTSRLLLKLGRLRKCSIVCLVSDINALRDDTIDLNEEIDYWKPLKFFVFHNDRMKQLAEEKTGEKVSVNITMFDLLFEPARMERINSNEVVFAGNVDKCAFLKKLNSIPDVTWHIYSASNKADEFGVKYSRLYDDVEDRTVLSGSYGLVWEGENLENVDGPKGSYLKWVNPLKLSNYLLQGLPVITHNQAAVANLVTSSCVGFCVSSLFDVEEKIRTISEDDYQVMVNNVRGFSKKISTGYFTQEAIEGIVAKIRSGEKGQLS